MILLSTTIPLLRTTFVPDEKEAAPILCTVALQEAIITDLDNRIANLKKSLEDLQAQHTAVYNSLAANRSLFSPIRRLLPEILAGIFKHYKVLSETKVEIQYGRHSSRYKCILLLHVCHIWRDVAQGTPHLWADVTALRPNDIPYASLCLRHSGSVPLNIAINHYLLFDAERAAWEWGQTVPISSDFATAFFKKFPFVQKLYYTGPLSGLNFLLPAGSLKNHLYLEQLSLETFDTGESATGLSQLSEATRIHTLILRTEDVHLIPAIEPIIYLRNLVILNIGSYVVHVLNLLRACPGLEDLALHHGDSVLDIDAENEDAVSLPALQNLELKTRYGGTRTLGFLRLIRTLNLRRATLEVTPPDLRAWSTLSAFLSEVRTKLHHLSLSYLDLSSPTLHDSIKVLTELETLEIRTGYGDQAALWISLTPEENAPPTSWVCPRLAHLRLSQIGPGVELIEFVRRRTESSYQANGNGNVGGWIRDITVEWNDGFWHDENSLEALRELQLEQNGLSITGLPPRDSITPHADSESVEE